MLKKRLQIVCEDTNESSEVFKTSHVYPVKFRIIGIFNRALNIDYHGKNVPYRYMSDILLNKVLIISDIILGK